MQNNELKSSEIVARIDCNEMSDIATEIKISFQMNDTDDKQTVEKPGENKVHNLTNSNDITTREMKPTQVDHKKLCKDYISDFDAR